MSYLSKANLAYSIVAVAPSPALSGTTLTLANGEGALFPTGNFTITIYPPQNPLTIVNPLASTSEICLCTSRTGDVLTIVRAQEGTTARSIRTGWQVANTATKLNFTEIENSIIQFVSAGTTKASAPEVVFSNANGVTFGASGQTITASVLITGTGGGGGAAISAGGNSQNTGTVIFSNSNGVSFGLNAGTLTASHNGITSQSVQPQSTQPVAASASNGSFAFSTLGFSNANGVTFGTSAGSLVTASVAAGAAAGSIAAGGSTLALGQVVFSNSNGISFSLNGSTITASHNGLTSQSAQAASASNGSFAFQTLAFSNANNVTFGTSAGSIITASVATAAAGNSVNFSAGTTSNNLASIVFSNSNGIGFGLDGSTMTASHNGLTSQSNQAASASNGSFTFQTLGFSNANNVTFGTSAGSIITASVSAGGAGVTLTGFQPYGPQPIVSYSLAFGASFMNFSPLDFPCAVQFDRVCLPVFVSITAGVSTGTISQWIGFYSRNDSSISLIASSSTSQSLLQGNASNSSGLYAGFRLLTLGMTTTLSAGNYFVGVMSQTSGANFNIANGSVPMMGSAFYLGVLGVPQTSTNQITLGLGYYTLPQTAPANSYAFTDLHGASSNVHRPQVFYLGSGTA